MTRIEIGPGIYLVPSSNAKAKRNSLGRYKPQLASNPTCEERLNIDLREQLERLSSTDLGSYLFQIGVIESDSPATLWDLKVEKGRRKFCQPDAVIMARGIIYYVEMKMRTGAIYSVQQYLKFLMLLTITGANARHVAIVPNPSGKGWLTSKSKDWILDDEAIYPTTIGLSRHWNKVNSTIANHMRRWQVSFHDLTITRALLVQWPSILGTTSDLIDRDVDPTTGTIVRDIQSILTTIVDS